MDKLDFLERGVLRLAATEIQYRHDVPFKVVIDEYVELTKILELKRLTNLLMVFLMASERHREIELNNRDP